LYQLTEQYANLKVPAPEQTFTASHKPFGSLLIGPIIKDFPDESLEEYVKRESSTKYRLSAVLGAEALGTSIILQEDFLLCRLRDTATNRVIYPMAIMHDCFNGDVLKRSDRQALR
jgi:hypothetical protein